MRFSKAVVRYRVPILLLVILLLIPAALGYFGTRVNYDMLTYLPKDMDTVIGQDALMEDFGKGAFSFVILEDMPEKDAAALKAKLEQVDHVESVLWYDSLADLSVPMELLPEKVYRAFNTENATMMAVFFDSSTSADVTMDAIREILTQGGRTLAQGCLAWLWARGENTVPVPGFRTEKQARDNAAALALGPLTEGQMRQIDIALDRA